MRHETNSNTSNEEYVKEKMKFDMQNAFLQRPSANSLLKAFAHTSLTCNPRASNDRIGILPPDPAINALEKTQSRLKFEIKQEYPKINLKHSSPTPDWGVFELNEGLTDRTDERNLLR